MLPETEGLSLNSWFDLTSVEPLKAPLLSAQKSVGPRAHSKMQEDSLS